jgi:methionyl-tRNA formyltransferase
MHSIYWALWEGEPRWLEATVHTIDEGIDTGAVLANAPVEPRFPGERLSVLFIRATELGVERLVDVLLQLARGEHWVVAAPVGKQVYRSTISGWKLGLMEVRAVMRRFERSEGPMAL